MNRDDFLKRFDGKHKRGTLTLYGAGAAPEHQLISLYMEWTNKETGEIIRLEYQLTHQQAIDFHAMTKEAIDKLSATLN